jgi:hypothetical protein
MAKGKQKQNGGNIKAVRVLSAAQILVYVSTVVWIYFMREAKGPVWYFLFYPYLIFFLLGIVNIYFYLKHLYRFLFKGDTHDLFATFLIVSLIILIFGYSAIYEAFVFG